MHHCLAPPKNPKLGAAPSSPLAMAPTFRKVKIFCSLAPFTSPFWKSWKLGTKPPPGRTCLQEEGVQGVMQWAALGAAQGEWGKPKPCALGGQSPRLRGGSQPGAAAFLPPCSWGPRPSRGCRVPCSP